MVQSNAEEVQSAAPVHGRSGHIERETSDGGIHENSEVVSQISTGHAKSPHTRQDEDGASCEENSTDDGLVHGSVEGLVCQGDLVDMITEDSQRKDSESQEVASSVGSTKDAGEDVAVVLC